MQSLRSLAAYRVLYRALLLVALFCPFCSPPASASPMNTPVIGGSQVPRGRWPDVVAVMMKYGVCTGTLVAQDVVLTAAHCLDGLPYEVIVDTIDYGRAGGERIRIAWARAYPNWQQRFDIAVLVLDQPATFAKPRFVSSACTTRKLLEPGRMVDIVGFGLASLTLESNTRLHQASVPITDPTCTLDPACNPNLSPTGEFIAGGHGADSCFGDSGGPVFIDAGPPFGQALVGVVSRGLALPAAACGNGGVYVRVDKVISWIQSVTGRTLDRTHCSFPGDDPDELAEPASDTGCSASTGLGIGAALALLLCAWFLARRDRQIDVRDLDV
jgi:secreted trypsin-like serine protease